MGQTPKVQLVGIINRSKGQFTFKYRGESIVLANGQKTKKEFVESEMVMPEGWRNQIKIIR